MAVRIHSIIIYGKSYRSCQIDVEMLKHSESKYFENVCKKKKIILSQLGCCGPMCVSNIAAEAEWFWLKFVIASFPE